MIKTTVKKRLALLCLIVAISVTGIITAGPLWLELVIGAAGLCGSFIVLRGILDIIEDLEKNQATLKEQNLKIIKKSIELSDIMRQFEDKNYDLELSKKEINLAFAAIKEKERDQRIIFDKSPLGIIRLNAEGRILYCNDKLSELMGTPKATLIGFDITKTKTPPMQNAFEKAIQGEISIFEGRFSPRPDAEPLDLRVIFNPVDPKMIPTDVIATIEDISKRVAAQQQLKRSHAELENLVRERTAELTQEIEDRIAANEALKKSEEKYRSILESIEDSYFELDLKGRLVFFNSAVPSLLGYSQQELVGMHYKTYTAQEDIPVLMEVFKDVYRTGQTSDLVHCNFYTKDRQLKNIGIIASLMQDKSGEPVGFRGLARDVTQQRLMENKLQHRQKMEAIGNLAGGVAHDFNNILGGIIGYAQLIKKHSEAVPKIQPYVDQVMKASERATGLVKQILLFSRNTESEKIPSDMVLIAAEVLKLLRASIPSTIEIRHHFEKDLNPVLADQTQIHQVFMNLCSNAAHAMKGGGGCLELKLAGVDVTGTGGSDLDDELQPGGYVRITVSDTGVGMDRRTLQNIFDPYFTTKESGEGTGLGLATVHGIVKDHGGVIHVSSRLGAGTRFEIYLPTIAHAVEKIQPVVTIEKGSEKILFVDDEVYLADVGKEMLEDYGYSVTALTSSRQALDLFARDPFYFDLVITDYTMPELTGAQLSKEIKALNPDLPIVMCTGISVDTESIQGIEFESVLMKPLDLDSLLVQIRRILDKN